MTEDRYSTPAGVEAAIAAAARKAHATDPSGSVSDRIRQEYFRRFLSRIFSEEGDSDWLLKGRHRSARSHRVGPHHNRRGSLPEVQVA